MIYLHTVDYYSSQAQPTVQTVHVGDFSTIVEVKNRHHGHHGQNEGQGVQGRVDQLHRQFAALPAPGESVHNDG